MESKVLYLTLKKKWFDMILSGEKKEEYREVKQYWRRRLLNPSGDRFKPYNVIEFTNGYNPNSPSFQIECIGFDCDFGNPDWGAELGVNYYIIKLGKIISTKNINGK